MHFDVLTLFPRMFEGVLNESIIKRARERGLVSIQAHDLRQWTHDKRRTVDDKPYGGGPGMVMRPEPIFEACDALRQPDSRIILISPQGRPLCQEYVGELTAYPRILLICGHYEGFDERVRTIAHEELSVGDYVLTGGEIPAMAIMDAVIRLIPGVLGQAHSLSEESFSQGLLEYPHYTRPRRYRDMAVPEILLSGNHAKIAAWRTSQARQRTRERRADLWGQYTVP